MFLFFRILWLTRKGDNWKRRQNPKHHTLRELDNNYEPVYVGICLVFDRAKQVSCYGDQQVSRNESFTNRHQNTYPHCMITRVKNVIAWARYNNSLVNVGQFPNLKISSEKGTPCLCRNQKDLSKYYTSKKKIIDTRGTLLTATTSKTFRGNPRMHTLEQGVWYLQDDLSWHYGVCGEAVRLLEVPYIN